MNLKSLHKISYGLYVVTSKKEEKLNGQIANTVFQITSDPATIAISINKGNLTHEFIETSKVFSALILSQGATLNLIGHFGFKSGRGSDKFSELDYKTGALGLPIELEGTMAYFEAEVINSLDMGTHTIFIGKIVGADVTSEGEPMTYAYYHLLKQGKVKAEEPKPPSNLTEKVAKNSDNAEIYECTVCGYLYDPKEGDPERGIEPGTKFENLPEDWTCPICNVSKDMFEKVEG